MVTSSIPVTDSAFVGRESELKGLTAQLQESLLGNGRFVVIKGEAGIGKTRLVNQLAKQAQDEGFDFLIGRCQSLEQNDPYIPFMEALKDKMGKTEGSQRDNMPLGLMGFRGQEKESARPAQDVPLGLLGITEGKQPDITAADIQTEKDKLFDSILETIKRSSSKKPMMLFIDDLHWGDSNTLQLLLFIARNITASRVLLCAAFRTEEVDQNGRPLRFYEFFKEMIRDIPHTSMTLNRLNKDEMTRMINNILGIKDVPGSFVSKLYDESEGNPFFVEEVLRSLMDEGIILRHGHVWDAGVDLSKIRIPNTIKDVIGHRIARLDDTEKKVLRYASVAGDHYTFEILREVTDIDDETLLDSIDRLMEADIIQEVTGSDEEEYQFDHKLIRSVIYESMSRSRVRLMHKSVGEAIEKIYANNLDPWIYELARHFSLGKHIKKNYQYSMMAGDKAFTSLALDRAVEYYISALRTIDLLPSEEDFDKNAEKQKISMIIGNLYNSLGLWNNSIRYYEGALNAAKAREDEKGEVYALISLGHSKRASGNYMEAEMHYEMAVETAMKTNDVQSLGEIQRGLGYVHWRKGENDDAIEHYNQGISFSMKAGDLSSMSKTFIELGNVYNNWGQYEKAIEYYEKSTVELEKLNDYFELSRAYNNIGDTYLHMKEWDKAIHNFDKCRDASEKIGNKNMYAWAMFNSAEALAHIGELDKAESNCLQALNICETQDDKIGMNGVYRCLGIVYRFKKDYEKAIENINKSIVILEMLDIPFDLANTYYELGLTYWEMDEKMAALDNLGISRDFYSSVGAKDKAKETDEMIKELKGR